MPKQDVVVIGAGLTAVLAARSLTKAGRSVVVLDAGPRLRGALPKDAAALEAHVGRSVKLDEKRWAFRQDRGQYSWLRVRAVGGRTLLWGGWMDRPVADYFDARRRAGAGWPFDLDELAPWLRRAKRELSVKQAKLAPALLRLGASGLDVQPKREALFAGGRRPLTALDLAKGMSVVADAPALRLIVDIDGAVRGVVAVVRGKVTRLECSCVVLAASPIETARILHQTPRAPSTGLGAALHDHLVAGAIAIAPRAPAAARAIGDADPNAGVIFPVPGDEPRVTVEIRGPKPLESLDDEDLSTLGFDRAAAKERSLYAVFAMSETDPRARRSVSFDELSPNDLGQPTPVFDFAPLTAQERATASTLRARVKDVARALGGPRAVVHLIQDPRELGGVGHETGTCPMGAAGNSIVDERGAVHGVRGAWIADASPFPGALDRHPSLTLAAYALRTASFAARGRRRG